MRAILTAHQAPGGFALGEIEPPVPGPSETLVRVAAISLNRGEVSVAGLAPEGICFGEDFAGTVERPAADGSGPPLGARVVGLVQQAAWAELVAVAANRLAELPAGVSFAQAAALPVAGLTARYALDRRGSVAGQRVLVTGASGGVGLFACRLARIDGAERVVGVVRNAANAGAVRDAGAHEVVIGEDTQDAGAFGPYDVILESVGGASLATALEQLAPEGVCISYGWSGSASSTIAIPPFVLNGRSSLQGFFLHRECEGRSVADGLAYLVELVGNRAMPVVIGAEASWDEMGQIAQHLIARSFAGKAILHLTTR